MSVIVAVASPSAKLSRKGVGRMQLSDALDWGAAGIGGHHPPAPAKVLGVDDRTERRHAFA